MIWDAREVYVVVAEWGGQGPIVMETEGQETCLEAAQERARAMLCRSSPAIRTAVARLVFESGNELLIHDLKRLQK